MGATARSPHGSPAAVEAALVEQRGRLLAHCYRLLGSLSDAEDAVQTTIARALAAREQFDGRAAPGTWLHAIATRCCLDELRRRPRRAVPAGLGVEPDTAGPWIGPLPESPEGAHARREVVSLAFVALLQRLPPRQRAALVLAEALDWSAADIASALRTTVPAVRSALVRARATLRSADPPRPAPDDEAVRALAARLIAAWEAADADALAALLADEAVLSMPPEALWVPGRAAIAAFLADTVWPERSFQLRALRANGTLALAVWMARPPGPHRAHALMLVHLDDRGAVRSLVAFREPDLLRRAGLSDEIGTDRTVRGGPDV